MVANMLIRQKSTPSTGGGRSFGLREVSSKRNPFIIAKTVSSHPGWEAATLDRAAASAAGVHCEQRFLWN